MRACRKCGKGLPVVGAIKPHVCKFAVGMLVRLPDGRTATIVGIKTKRVGEVVTVSLPATGQRGGPRSYPTFLADVLRWVT